MKLIDVDTAYAVLTDYYHQRTSMQQAALREALDRIPAIEVEPLKRGNEINENDLLVVRNTPKTGKWLVDEDGNVECSICGHHGVGDAFCERCGARMITEEEEA